MNLGMSTYRPHKLIRFATVGIVLILAGCASTEEKASTSSSSSTTSTPSTTKSPATTASPTQATTTTSAPTTTTSTLPPPEILDVDLTETERSLILDSGEVRVAVDKVWGTAIREIWLGDRNLVNNYDGGRLIGISVYDSAQRGGSHPNDTGWNATPSDWHDHPNPPIEHDFDGRTLHTRVRNLQWFPEGHGGGPDTSIATDVIVETWVDFFDDPRMMHVRYRLTHEGTDSHLLAPQEFPFAYGRTPFDRYVTYAGDSPWTGGAITLDEDLPVFPERGELPASEHWGGLVDEQGIGLVVWAPQAYPSIGYHAFDNPGPAENAATYLLPKAFGPIEPGMTWETEAFFFAGHHEEARELIYDLERRLAFGDKMFPYGNVDTPGHGAPVSGVVEVTGWAIDDRGVKEVEVVVDGETVGAARYGLSRADVAEEHGGLPDEPRFGFSFSLDTADLGSGAHDIEVIARDAAGNASTLLPGLLSVTAEGP